MERKYAEIIKQSKTLSKEQLQNMFPSLDMFLLHSTGPYIYVEQRVTKTHDPYGNETLFPAHITSSNDRKRIYAVNPIYPDDWNLWGEAYFVKDNDYIILSVDPEHIHDVRSASDNTRVGIIKIDGYITTVVKKEVDELSSTEFLKLNL